MTQDVSDVFVRLFEWLDEIRARGDVSEESILHVSRALSTVYSLFSIIEHGSEVIDY